MYKLKEMISEALGLVPESIKLVYKGKLLADEKKLGEYEMVTNDKVYMVLLLNGGAA